MKPAIYACLFLASFNIASAKIIEIDGERYQCELMGEDKPDGVLNCVNKAYSGPFSQEESRQLCQGARNDMPAQCGLRLYSGPFNKEETIRICKGSRTLGPAECAELAYSGPFNKEETMELCGHPRATKGNAECALKAFSGPYGKVESIQMCKVSSAELQFSSSKHSQASTQSSLSKEGLNELVILANKKAFEQKEYKTKK